MLARQYPCETTKFLVIPHQTFAQQNDAVGLTLESLTQVDWMRRVASGRSCSSIGIFKNKELCHGIKYKIKFLGSLTRAFFKCFLLITPRSDRLPSKRILHSKTSVDTQRKWMLEQLSLPLDRLFKLNHQGVMYHDASCCVLHGMDQSSRAHYKWHWHASFWDMLRQTHGCKNLWIVKPISVT